MTFSNDLSLSTLIISTVVALVGWGLKGVGALLMDAIKNLITKLIETIAKVELLDAKLSDVIKTVGDVEKMRDDINAYYKRLKELEIKMQK